MKSIAPEQKLFAGNFTTWLNDTVTSLQNDKEAFVSCGDCSACCRSSYFIHIKPSDVLTLSHVPEELLFSAPGLPAGHKLMGYDEKGRCPMFINESCSIYQYRPQICKQYDCRIFPATNIQLDDEDKSAIAQQSIRWEFKISSKQDELHLKAVQHAAKFLTDQKSKFPKGFIPGNTTQQATLAIRIYPIFLSNPDITNTEDIINQIFSLCGHSKSAVKNK